MSASIKNKLAGKTSKLGQKKETIEDHPAAINNYSNGSFFKVDIDQIKPDPNQPRQIFDEVALNELAESIKQKGVLQPVIIRKDDEDNIWLVAGERRWRASKIAGLEKIPAILTTGNPGEISLIENIQRENLKPIEEAEGYAHLMEQHNYTQEQLAQVVGKSRSTITNTLSLNKLPDKLKEECFKSDIPKRVLIEISHKKDEAKMLALFEQYKSGFSSKAGQKPKPNKPRKQVVRRSKALIASDRMSGLSDFLTKINLENESEDEKIEMLREAAKLRSQLDNLLN